MDFGGLAVGVPCSDALAEGLEAAHPGFGAAAGVVSRPSLPERTAVVTRSAQGFVARPGCGTILLPRSAVLADRDDRGGAARDDGAVRTVFPQDQSAELFRPIKTCTATNTPNTFYIEPSHSSRAAFVAVRYPLSENSYPVTVETCSTTLSSTISTSVTLSADINPDVLLKR
jgi:hypothetical protein